MKKILFVSALIVAGFMKANTPLEVNTIVNDNSYSNEVLKNFKDSFGLCAYPIYYTTSCGVAAVTYNNNMSGAEMLAWADKLEQNYCGDDAPYSNTSGMY